MQAVKVLERRQAGARREVAVEVQGKRLKLSNLDKALYPSGFTKAQVIDYYVRVSPHLLRHLEGRPFTLKRYPEGSDRAFFYEKECPSHRPSWVPTIEVERGDSRARDPDGVIHYCSVDTLPVLVWIANLASLELHVLQSKKQAIDRPTTVAFDLDPGHPAGLVDCCDIGLQLKRMLEALGLESFPKTSGGKGLHVYVPLNTPATYGQTKAFAHAMAQLLERRDRKAVSKMSKALRKGKVFVDWSQNDEHKTTVCAYSLRARERPTVSTPVTWDEVRRCFQKKDPEILSFEAEDVLTRIEKSGDLFAPVLKLKQHLPKA